LLLDIGFPMTTNLPTGFDRLIDLIGGACDLTVWVRAEADLDGEFEAICDDTGDRLRVNGWMFEVA